MSAPKLDPATLRETIRLLAAIEVNIGMGQHESWARGMRCASGLLRDLAAEAEARKPDLSDWITSATRSDLGLPGLMTKVTGGALVLKWYGRTFVDIYADDGFARMEKGRGESVRFDSPADLLAGLNALAGVKP